MNPIDYSDEGLKATRRFRLISGKFPDPLDFPDECLKCGNGIEECELTCAPIFCGFGLMFCWLCPDCIKTEKHPIGGFW
jgi:hypothetical protein